jgi:hypothetical protein
MHGNINVFRFYAFRLYAIFPFVLVLDGLFFAQVLIQALDWFDGCSMLFYELERPKLAFLVGCWVTGDGHYHGQRCGRIKLHTLVGASCF